MEKMQIYLFTNGNTTLTDVISRVIVRHVQTPDLRDPIWYLGSSHHPIWDIRTQYV